MSDIRLVLGGARSGKSRYALSVGAADASSRYFLATSEPLDDEMKSRIELHKEERGAGWETIEVPLDLVQVINNIDQANSLVVVDCLTLWLGNLMHYGRNVEQEIQGLTNCLARSTGRYVIVSNEVGLGIVPESAMSREFRDHQGRANQQIAAVAQKVDLLVAGIPLKIKE